MTTTWTPQYTPTVPAPKRVWVISRPRRGRRDLFTVSTSDPKTAEAYAAQGYTVERFS